MMFKLLIGDKLTALSSGVPQLLWSQAQGQIGSDGLWEISSPSSTNIQFM